MKKLHHIFKQAGLTALIILALGLANSPRVVAASWEAGYIIDDSKFTNSGAMNAAMIQSFFQSKNSVCLLNYNGSGWAAAVIKQEADNYGINPQVLLATLQKETGLVTTTSCDDWKYRTAMGFGCPDSAPCDSQYFGFQNQMHQASRHFRGFYDQNPGWYIPFIPGNRFIAYNPNGACGGTNVNIINRATASLYSYTPYQPNAAAIAAGYGEGDGCSAYGNRNFWLFFNDWFGPSKGEGYVLAIADNGDPRQWVIMKGKRYWVNQDAKDAYGLPAQPITMDHNYLGSFAEAPAVSPDGTALWRLMRPTGTQDVYFVDSTKCYKVVSIEMLNAWNFNPARVVDVAVDLAQLPQNLGNLTYAIKSSSNPTDIYLVDSGAHRRYANADILTAWEGSTAHTIISSAYFNSMGNDSDITNTKVSAGPGQQEYQVVAGQKLPESVNVAQLYPGVAVPNISVATINRLVTSAGASQFVRAADSDTVYMVNAAGGVSYKHPVSSIEILRAWGVGVNPPVNLVTQGNLNLLTNGSTLNTFEADSGGQLYLMDGRRISVSSALDSAYRTANVFSASQSLINLSLAGEPATNFIKGFNTPAIYLIDNGSIRNIGTPNQLSLWNNGENVNSVSEYLLSQFSIGATTGVYVKDSLGNEYAAEGGTLHHISPDAKTHWGLVNAVTLHNNTINRWPKGGDLGFSLQNSGRYYKAIKGTAFLTVDGNIAAIWDSVDSPVMNPMLANELAPPGIMSKFVRSSIDSSLFVSDNSTLRYLSLEHATNLGLNSSSPIMTFDPSGLTGANWNGVVLSAAGGYYVVDNGGKRTFPNPAALNQWTAGATNIISVSSAFINLLPDRGIVDKAIKGSDSKIYAISPEGGVISKHWITNPNTYAANYGRFEQVSDQILAALPDGPNVN